MTNNTNLTATAIRILADLRTAENARAEADFNSLLAELGSESELLVRPSGEMLAFTELGSRLYDLHAQVTAETLGYARTALKDVAVTYFEVDYTRFGHPCAIDGEVLPHQPWVTLKFRVLAARLQTILGYELEVAAKSLATPPAPAAPELHHVAETLDEADVDPWIGDLTSLFGELPQVEAAPVAEVAPVVAPVVVKPAPVAPKPQALHPLRGYVITQKQRVCEAMKRLYRVGLDKLSDVQVFAKLLAKHLKADVRVRVISGVTWLLVKKGGSAKAFQF